VQGEDIGRRQCEADIIGRDFFGKAMNGVELRDGLPVGVVKTFR
jgi:hypothetical protein